MMKQSNLCWGGKYLNLVVLDWILLEGYLLNLIYLDFVLFHSWKSNDYLLSFGPRRLLMD